MQADEIRFLFAYDRWATRQLLGVLDGLDPALWARTDVVGERVWEASSSTTSALPSDGASDSKRGAPTKDPSRSSSRCRRSTSCANGGRRSGPRSMRGCRP